ncbi:serine/threonine protein phosphatase PrpC [Pseudomonas sp. SJZ080]|uniref:PP2C family protein-serine/threonine phosphatase n=1 Tax=Pseudomonas sp. SJZ080 TaxID=2572888 RepID=UPI0011991BD4|nr:serine/threonine protein phosphatase [Pseudomonas sp. SJZ080]TWC49576.1 serine/threonine protein phosphatase PrpC [Pseudomonas sp. SJZ080]
MRYNTRSVTGRTRKTNHDYAGALCDGDRGLFVITDGTSKPGSGQLAECFVKGVLEAYPKHMEQGADITEHGAVEQVLGSMLAELHPALFAGQTGTTCYLVGFAAHGKLTLAYEGDCSCGVVTPAGMIKWITPPHCKANWRRDRSHRELAQDPARNWITRCLKADRAPNPDFVFHPLAVGEQLVFVTDGFWAELTESQQSSLLAAPDSDFVALEDDVTWIDVQF